jgi:hypothetical protein
MTLHHGTKATVLGTCTFGLRTCTPYGFGRQLVAVGILRRPEAQRLPRKRARLL